MSQKLRVAVLAIMAVLMVLSVFYPDEAQAIAAILTLAIVLFQWNETKSELAESQRTTKDLLDQLKRDSEITSIVGRLHAYFEMRQLSRVAGGTQGETQTKESQEARSQIPVLMDKLVELTREEKS